MMTERAATRRVVAVITDGLRRDLVTPELTPTIAALRKRGTWFGAHRSVFPSCTRVVSSSFSTGCLPSTHGLAGNSMCLVDNGRLVLHDVGKPEFVDEKRRLTGRVLNRPTLAERLARVGGGIVFNNVSPGAAYMHDPDGHGHVYHRAGSFAPGKVRIEGDDELLVVQGPDGDTEATRRFATEVVKERRPAYALLWLSEPDTTQHKVPLGSPRHREVLAATDRNVATVLAAVEDCRRAGEEILLLVGSDHGHETVIETIDVGGELVRAGLKQDAESDDVVVAPNGTGALVYVDPRHEARIGDIGRFLAAQAWSGQVFGRDRLAEAGVPSGGGLAFAVAMAASETPSAFGVPGSSYAVGGASAKSKPVGCGQHGGLGRYEQSPYLIVEGAGFAPGAAVEAPTSAIDVAPTILRFLGQPEEELDGRALQGVT
jgi:arylsulfatase A-like enzyme